MIIDFMHCLIQRRGGMLNDKNITYAKLKDLCVVLTGGEPPVDSIKSKFPAGEYIYPILSNGVEDKAIWGYASTYRINRPAITFSSIGTIGKPVLRNAYFTPVIRLKVIYPNDESKLNISYLKYFLDTIDLNTNSSTIANINSDTLKNIEIMFPPIEIQNQIVSILDQFNNLTTNLQDGIPAEIKLRKEQYQYYLKQLLSFNSEIKQE